MADSYHYHSHSPASVRDVFFSLKGTLPRDQWCLAMIIAVAVFQLGLALLRGDGDAAIEASWLYASWAFSFVVIVSLLVAKRLLDIGRPVWLALSVMLPGLMIIAGFLSGWTLRDEGAVALLIYLALFALPALIACFRYETGE